MLVQRISITLSICHYYTVPVKSELTVSTQSSWDSIIEDQVENQDSIHVKLHLILLVDTWYLLELLSQNILGYLYEYAVQVWRNRLLYFLSCYTTSHLLYAWYSRHYLQQAQQMLAWCSKLNTDCLKQTLCWVKIKHCLALRRKT